MPVHRTVSYLEVHVAHSLEYATAVARNGAVGLLAVDIGRIARQLDDGSFYVLANHSPLTWKAMSLELTNNPPAPLGFPAFAGVATTAAREDHVHVHGAVAGGTTHPDAVAGSPGTSGYISGVNQLRLNNLLEVLDEGSTLGTGKTKVNFQGAGVLAVVDGGDPNQINVTVPGSGTATINVQDEGTPLAPDKNKLNFIGAAVAATTDGGDPFQANITITAPPSTRNLTAGAGMVGGGDLSADRTFDVAANADGSIIVNANDVQVGVLATDAQHGTRGGGTLHSAAVAAGASGFLTGADKQKIDGLQNSLLLFGNSGVTATTTTRYLSPGYTDATGLTTPVQFRVPSACHLSKLRVRQNTGAGNGNNIVYTVRVNGVATALAATLASTANDGSNLANTIAVAAGDLIDLEVTKAASVATSPSDITATMELSF